jgi:hypothetical protein
MKALIFVLALVSSTSFAADCGRKFGTPGFIAKDAVMAMAKAKAKGDCEGYQYYNGISDGSCSDMGCVEKQGEFTCTAMIIVCQ